MTLSEIVKKKNIKLSRYEMKIFGGEVAARFAKFNKGKAPNKTTVKVSSGTTIKVADYPGEFVPIVEQMIDQRHQQS